RRVDGSGLVGRRQETRADRLREPERVAGAKTRLQQHVLRVDPAGDRHPVFGLTVDHRVSARDDRAGLGDLVDRALKEPLQLLERAGAQLRPSAGAGGQRRQPDLIACEHRGRWYSGKRGRRADGRVPERGREREKEKSESEVRDDPPAADEHEEQKDRCGRHEDEVEDEKEERRAHITLYSRMRSPEPNREARKAAMSNEVRPSTMSSAMSSPVAGACMIPWPEKPAAATKPSTPSTVPRTGCLSGVSSYRPAQPVLIDARSRI